jgi:SAM-dependent methyltransferase
MINIKRLARGFNRRLRTAVVSRMSPIKDISHFLHDCRSSYLRSMPRVDGVMLSAGCAGKWYFDWIADKTGHRARHIGIEFFTPKPGDLPSNVDWIANTVGVMDGVESEECELVFSGENLEHLWPEDVVGFFLESWRVLKPGGWLVVDSPNRLMTAPLNWSHPEHTVEITPDEARHLATLAGFDVVNMKGIWVCRDAKTDRIMALDPNMPDDQWPTIERCLSAVDDPDNSFLWWMEARKSSREPDVAALTAEMDKIFSDAWPERSRRFVSAAGTRNPDNSGISSASGETGALVYGPYMPLRKGNHSATFELTSTDPGSAGTIIARIDVLGSNGREILFKDVTYSELQNQSGKFTLDFSLPEMEFSIQARCISYGKSHLNCRFPTIV